LGEFNIIAVKPNASRGSEQGTEVIVRFIDKTTAKGLFSTKQVQEERQLTIFFPKVSRARFEMDNSMEELDRRVEIQKQKQREHEDYILSYVNSFLGLIVIVKSKYRLDETKVSARAFLG
jgi:hypothetical protein